MNVRQYRKHIPLYFSVLTAIPALLFWFWVDKPFQDDPKNLSFANFQQEKIIQFEKQATGLLDSLAEKFKTGSESEINELKSIFFQENIDVFTQDRLIYGDFERYSRLKNEKNRNAKSLFVQIKERKFLSRKHIIYHKGEEITFVQSTEFPIGLNRVDINDKESFALYNVENERIGYVSPLHSPYSQLLIIHPVAFYLFLLSFFCFSVWILPRVQSAYRTNQTFSLFSPFIVWLFFLKLTELSFSYRFPFYPTHFTTPFLEGGSLLNPTFFSNIISQICVLALVGIFSLKLHKTTFYKQAGRLSQANKQIISISLVLVGFVGSQFILEELNTLYHFLGISGQFTEVFREEAPYISFLVSFQLIAFQYFLLLHPLFILFNSLNTKRTYAYIAILAGSLCWFLILLVSQSTSFTSLILFVGWIFQFEFDLPHGFYKIRHKTSFYILLTVYSFSFFGASSSFEFERKQIDECQTDITNTFLTQAITEFLDDIHSIQQHIQRDTSQQSFVLTKEIREAYIQQICKNYLNDSIGFETFITGDPTSFLKKNFTTTSFKDIYENTAQNKIVLFVAKGNKKLVLSFERPLVSLTKKSIQNALTSQQEIALRTKQASIALINLPHFKVLDSYGDETAITDEYKSETHKNQANFASFQIGNTWIYQYKIANNLLLSFQFSGYSWTDFWGSFAFLSLVLFLFLFICFIPFSLFGYSKIGRVTSLTTKIVIYIQASFLIPLLITTFFIIQFFDKEIKYTQKETYFQETELLRQQVKVPLESWQKGELTDTIFLKALQNIHLKPLQAFILKDVQGKTMYSSAKKGTIENIRIDSSYWENKADSTLFFHGKTNATISFTGIQKPIYDANTSKIGYVQGFFFGSIAQQTNREASLITSILFVFLILFNGLFLISFLLSKRLINPIKAVAQRLNNTTLSELTDKERLPLVVHDEIGLLVDAYNSMIRKLEESKDAIAEAEKQTAWQEIARQVAHEIKNPLTPMKLSIQRLQRNLAKNPGQPPTPEMMESLSLLIDQIDDISTIASSFSSYAQMPIPKKVRINLTEIVQKSVQFMLTSQQTHISFHSSQNEIWVLQDPSFMDRLLKNILLNGIQSVPKGILPQIKVEIDQRNRSAVISIKDNGTGIPDEHKDKIFLPHFSTKKIGSGIGLAIAKKGIESMGGNIWFESQEGSGTTFYVEVPLQETIL